MFNPLMMPEKSQNWKDTILRRNTSNLFVVDIKGTTHQRYYGGNWLCFLMNLERHRSYCDVDMVVKAINSLSLRPGPTDRFLDPISLFTVRFLLICLAVTKVFHIFVATKGYRYQLSS